MMISQSWKDWTESPVVTSTDNVEAPIKNLPFPSLIVCKKDPNYHDNWRVPELIYNFIDINSDDPKVKHLMAGFSDFTANLIDKYLKESPSNYDGWSTMVSSLREVYETSGFYVHL